MSPELQNGLGIAAMIGFGIFFVLAITTLLTSFYLCQRIIRQIFERDQDMWNRLGQPWSGLSYPPEVTHRLASRQQAQGFFAGLANPLNSYLPKDLPADPGLIRALRKTGGLSQAFMILAGLCFFSLVGLIFLPGLLS